MDRDGRGGSPSAFKLRGRRDGGAVVVSEDVDSDQN
jgi:hypothetical protein